MSKEFIPYEQALELKELGFDDYNIAWYAIVDEKPKIVFLNYGSHLCAPLYQQAFRWFREKGCLFEVSVNNKTRVWENYTTYDEEGLEDGEERAILYSKHFDTYEEAELACFKKLIEIVKNE